MKIIEISRDNEYSVIDAIMKIGPDNQPRQDPEIIYTNRSNLFGIEVSPPNEIAVRWVQNGNLYVLWREGIDIKRLVRDWWIAMKAIDGDWLFKLILAYMK